LVYGPLQPQEMRLWRSFDWILCLEVGEHVPKQCPGDRFPDFAMGFLKNGDLTFANSPVKTKKRVNDIS